MNNMATKDAPKAKVEEKKKPVEKKKDDKKKKSVQTLNSKSPLNFI